MHFGIDLGTEYSKVAYLIKDSSDVSMIHFNDGSNLIPSIVSYTDDDVLVGQCAKDNAVFNHENTIYDIKLLIGVDYRNIPGQALRTWPFKVLMAGKNNHPCIELKPNEKIIYPEQILAKLLEEIKIYIQNLLGFQDVDAVITVPAYFNYDQLQKIKEASQIAGLNAIKFLNEPTAAAIAYYWKNRSSVKRLALIYDLGSGKFEASVIKVENNSFNILGTNVNAHLGGEEIDKNMVKHFIKIFNEKHNCDISKDLRARSLLKSICEKGKINLSHVNKTKLCCPSLYHEINFMESITREEFEDMNKDLFQATLITIHNLINEIKMKPEDIDDIFLVGGSSKISYVREMLKDFFGKEPLRIGIDPETAVAQGAAIFAANLNDIDVSKIKSVITHSIGIKAKNPNGDSYMDIIFSRYTPIPSSVQKTILIKESGIIEVYKGEDPNPEHNDKICKYTICNNSGNSEDEILIEFKVDEDGHLDLSAKYKSTGKSDKITIIKEEFSE
ncbi:Heat shock protein 70 2 [Histomonas meleagridis]|uniref:Heat shock protein 70 2 n=1 Tax=Histomonas meleagridis TaxID=135588 RepID=UPI00355A8210|nr:Heat shock protein 70 2 [Histomonas meleagridis]KAH0798132.1 Heat shock protein 70 2 [Histomonas meleagridis]